MFNIGRNREEKREDDIIDKQHSQSTETALLTNATNPQSELIQLKEQEEREDLVRWQQDLGPEMEQLEHDLKREVFDKKTNEWVSLKEWVYGDDGQPKEVDATPMCNDFCIQMIKATIRPFMTKNEIMSNYTEDRILQKMRNTLKTLSRNVGVKHDFYEIDFHDISSIRTIVQNAMMSAPFRALNQGERNYLKTSTRRIENLSDPTFNQQRKGLIKSLFS